MPTAPASVGQLLSTRAGHASGDAALELRAADDGDEQLANHGRGSAFEAPEYPGWVCHEEIRAFLAPIPAKGTLSAIPSTSRRSLWLDELSAARSAAL